MNKTKIKERFLEIRYFNKPTEFISVTSKLSDEDLIFWYYERLNTPEKRRQGFVLHSISPACEMDYVKFSLATELKFRINLNKN